MHLQVCRAVLCALVLGTAAFAQSIEDPGLTRAKSNIEDIRKLVEAGAAPRAKLDQAEHALADAEETAFLRRTLYGPDLTQEKSQEMVEMTQRRLERRKAELEDAKKLVDQGVAARLSITTPLEDLDRAQKEFDLAVSRAKLVHELTEMARTEAEQSRSEEGPTEVSTVAERYDGDGVFTNLDLQRVEIAFEDRFAKPLPLSAAGQTVVHRALGFDHRNRVDVALHPDNPEGVWLRHYLTTLKIPYFAFRRSVPGKATAAHIHIGPQSTRL